MALFGQISQHVAAKFFNSCFWDFLSFLLQSSSSSLRFLDHPACTYVLKSVHKVLVMGDVEGHIKTSNFLLLRLSPVNFKVCLCSFSCWRTHSPGKPPKDAHQSPQLTPLDAE